MKNIRCHAASHRTSRPAASSAIRSLALIPALAVTLLSSCSICRYDMTTTVHEDLSVDRRICAEADSSFLAGDKTSSPFEFALTEPWAVKTLDIPYNADFNGETARMNVLAERRFAPGERLCVGLATGDQEGNPLLSPDESVRKSFRWFVTRYEYRAVYRAVRDFPVPLDSCMTRDGQRLFLMGEDSPAGWSGLELYARLDELNSAFVKWTDANVFDVNMMLISRYLPEKQLRLLDLEREKLFGHVRNDESGLLGMNPREFCRRADEYFVDEPFMSEIYGRYSAEIDSLYAEREKILDYFLLTFVHEVDLPGRIVSTSAPQIGENGAARWKVDCCRLLYDDMEVVAESVKVNVWAVIVTFIVLMGLAWAVIAPRRR